MKGFLRGRTFISLLKLSGRWMTKPLSSLRFSPSRNNFWHQTYLFLCLLFHSDVCAQSTLMTIYAYCYTKQYCGFPVTSLTKSLDRFKIRIQRKRKGTSFRARQKEGKKRANKIIRTNTLGLLQGTSHSLHEEIHYLLLLLLWDNCIAQPTRNELKSSSLRHWEKMVLGYILILLVAYNLQ